MAISGQTLQFSIYYCITCNNTYIALFQFTKERLKELELVFGRLVAIVCDGATGKASTLLGLSDEFTTHSCRSYGAIAILERPDHRSVPAPG